MSPLPPLYAYVYCGQMAGWIKVPLGGEVGLAPGYIVLDRIIDTKLSPMERGTVRLCGLGVGGSRASSIAVCG